MSFKEITINEQTFNDFAAEAPSVAIVMIYALSKYYEKYLVTEWCMRILNERGFKKDDLKSFDKNFIDFFDAMIQEGNGL